MNQWKNLRKMSQLRQDFREQTIELFFQASPETSCKKFQGEVFRAISENFWRNVRRSLRKFCIEEISISGYFCQIGLPDTWFPPGSQDFTNQVFWRLFQLFLVTLGTFWKSSSTRSGALSNLVVIMMMANSHCQKYNFSWFRYLELRATSHAPVTKRP